MRAKKSEKRKANRARYFALGHFLLMHLPGGKVWLMRLDGEGMETTEEKLNRLLKRFWRREF